MGRLGTIVRNGSISQTFNFNLGGIKESNRARSISSSVTWKSYGCNCCKESGEFTLSVNWKNQSRKQQPAESLHQFWNNLNGLTAKCDFGKQTQSLVYDMFVLKMSSKKKVQERLCTEPKEDPLAALQFAIAFEEGIRRQKR